MGVNSHPNFPPENVKQFNLVKGFGEAHFSGARGPFKNQMAAFQRVISTLQTRGILSDSTPHLAESIGALLAAQGPPSRGTPPLSVYGGFDPTARSLHLGHAAVLVLMLRLQRAGLRSIALIGGATAMIGDPTGKSVDRPLLSPDTIAHNTSRIRASLEPILGMHASGSGPGFLILDNATFYEGLGVVPFLRDVGVHFRLAQLLARDSVRARMGWGEGGVAAAANPAAAGTPLSATTTAAGMSYTEFSYSLLQAYDYSLLHRNAGAVLQVGGSDQWGNITAGVELIRRLKGMGDRDAAPLPNSMGGKPSTPNTSTSLASSPSSSSSSSSFTPPPPSHPAHGATVPLLLDASGRKFGKTEDNAPLWLDPTLTSNFSIWQYCVGVGDGEVGRLLRSLTLLEEEEVEGVLKEGLQFPERKVAQMRLADEVVGLLRGVEAKDGARRTAQVLFAGTSMWGGGGGSDGIPSSSSTTTTTTTTANFLPQHALLATLQPKDLFALVDSGEVPRVSVQGSQVAGGGLGPVDALVALGMVKSKGEGRRLVEGGGVYWNWERVSGKSGAWSGSSGGEGRVRVATMEDFVGGEVAVLSVGKRKMGLVVLSLPQ
jgi:tyrosyl-tRNA synthetase